MYQNIVDRPPNITNILSVRSVRQMRVNCFLVRTSSQRLKLAGDKLSCIVEVAASGIIRKQLT